MWTAAEYAVASNTVQATVTCDLPDTRSISSTFMHGLCSSIRVVNFAQDGVAADGYVNQYHSTFNVTGTVVYNVTGATSSDTVLSKDPGEIAVATDIKLYRTGTVPPISSNTGRTGNFIFIIPAASIAAQAAAYTWTVQVTMNTGTVTVTASNSLSLTCDNIQITSITFSGGGGTPPPGTTYYRSVNVPSTQVTIQATKQYTGGNMIGATTITISDGTAPNFTVTIADGAVTGTANVKYPALAQTPNGQTTPLSYQVIAVAGSVFDNEQNTAPEIPQPANPVIYWDRNDPPGNNTGLTSFTTWVGVSTTGSSFTLSWTALDAALPDYDGDFYSYRIYYKLSSTSTWNIVDRSILGYGPGGTYRLDLIGTNSVTITGLIPLTNYDYFITAVDVFGQEVAHCHSVGPGTNYSLYNGSPDVLGYDTLTTKPTSIEITITDGINQYSDSSLRHRLLIL